MENLSKILVLEDRPVIETATYDHLFSMCENQADAFPDEFLKRKDEWILFDEVWDALMPALKVNRKDPLLTYRGVDLLWCFKKPLFFYANYSLLRHETLKRLMDKHPTSDIHLLRHPSNINFPYLVSIMEASTLKSSTQLSMREVPHLPQKKESNRSLKTFLSYFFSNHIKGPLNTRRIAVYSDYKKSKSIIFHCDPLQTSLYLDTFSPRILRKTLLTKLGVFQASYRTSQLYEQKAQEFHNQFSQSQFLSNVSLRELNLRQLLLPKIDQLFREQLPKLIFDIDQMFTFFKESKSLRTVLLDEDISPPKNAFCQIAKTFNVTSFVECHGALGHRLGFLPLTADFIFVWGNEQKKKLVKWGADPSQLIVTGCSRYVPYSELTVDQARHRVVRDLHLDPDKKIILLGFMTIKLRRNIFENDFQRVIRETLRVVKDISEYQFILKIQPGDHNRKVFETWIKKHQLEDQFKVIEHYDSMLLARGVDLLIIYDSTFAVDGLAMSKPVICLYDGSATPKLEEFRKYQAFYYSDSPEELKRLIQMILNETTHDPERYHQVHRECFNLHEMRANQRIAHYLRKEPNAIT